MSGKRGRGAAFPSDVVCSEQMYSPVSLWELWSRKSDYKGFGRQLRVLLERAARGELTLFAWSCGFLLRT